MQAVFFLHCFLNHSQTSFALYLSILFVIDQDPTILKNILLSLQKFVNLKVLQSKLNGLASQKLFCFEMLPDFEKSVAQDIRMSLRMFGEYGQSIWCEQKLTFIICQQNLLIL